MRTYIITISIILFGCFNSSAQVFKTGIIAGISASQVDGDGYGGYDKLGFLLGGFTNFDLSEKVNFQFEIYYINKGSRKNAHPDKGDFDYFKLNLNYIEVPLVISYRYKKFKFELGLYGGILLNYKMEDENGSITVFNYPFKKYELGGLFGFSYQLTDHFSCNIRSKNSITPIRDFQNKDANVGIYNKFFNRGWYSLDLNFSVSYQFGE